MREKFQRDVARNSKGVGGDARDFDAKVSRCANLRNEALVCLKTRIHIILINRSIVFSNGIKSDKCRVKVKKAERRDRTRNRSRRLLHCRVIGHFVVSGIHTMVLSDFGPNVGLNSAQKTHIIRDGR